MLSAQAKTTLVAYGILMISFLIPLKGDRNLSKKLALIVVMLIPISIAVYTINCLVTGSKAKFGLGCNVLAWMNSLSILVTGVLILLLNMSGENVLEEGFTNPSDLVGNYNFSDGTSIQLTDINEFNVDGNVLLLTSPDNFPNMPNNYIIGENNTLIKINTKEIGRAHV